MKIMQSVTGKGFESWIHARATALAIAEAISEPTFTASTGWLDGLLKRNGFTSPVRHRAKPKSVLSSADPDAALAITSDDDSEIDSAFDYASAVPGTQSGSMFGHSPCAQAPNPAAFDGWDGFGQGDSSGPEDLAASTTTSEIDSWLSRAVEDLLSAHTVDSTPFKLWLDSLLGDLHDPSNCSNLNDLAMSELSSANHSSTYSNLDDLARSCQTENSDHSSTYSNLEDLARVCQTENSDSSPYPGGNSDRADPIPLAT